MKQRFDISWYAGGPEMDMHFCREWDDEGGCYGTREDHGFSFDEAKAEIIEWHRREIDRLENLTYRMWSCGHRTADVAEQNAKEGEG